MIQDDAAGQVTFQDGHTGRPSIDPELMLRIPFVGYCYGIHSERHLCEEAP